MIGEQLSDALHLMELTVIGKGLAPRLFSVQIVHQK